MTSEAGGADGAPEVDASASDGAPPADGAAIDGRGADGATILCSAGDWYVDAVHGSDTNDGKSLATAFATIQHAANAAKAGQTVDIAAGTYRETVVPANSGVSGKPIAFRGCGQVTVSGAEPITSGWTASSGNIYKTAVTLPITGYSTKLTGNTSIVANQIFVGSEDATMKMMVQARWPNLSNSDDLLNMKDIRQACGFTEGDAGAAPSTVVLSDPATSAAAANGGLVGATIWWGGWFENHTGTVTASSTGTASFTFSDSGDGLGTSCSNESFAQWYYFVDKLALLDAEKEWYYDGTSLYLWAPGGASPKDVKYKARNYAFDLTGKSYVTLSNVSIVAATVVTNAQSQGITIDGIQARYISHHVALQSWPSGPTSGIRLEGPNSVIRNSSVQYSAGFGIVLGSSGNTAENNWVSDVDYAGTYDCGISPAAHPVNILHNTITRSGRSSVDGFVNDTISYNDLSAYGALNPDLGALYTCCTVDSTGSSIDHNVIHDQMAPYWAVGIYTDNSSGNALVHHNVFWNVGSHSVQRNSGTMPNSLYNNTDVDSPNGGESIGGASGDDERNNIFGGWTGTVGSANLYSPTNPLYLHPSTHDYELAAGSPAIDQGVVIPPYTDGYQGKGPDIGAYEYGSTPWVAGCNLAVCK